LAQTRKRSEHHSLLISSALHSHVTFNLELCDKIKLSNLLLPRKSGTIKRSERERPMSSWFRLPTQSPNLGFHSKHTRPEGIGVWCVGSNSKQKLQYLNPKPSEPLGFGIWVRGLELRWKRLARGRGARESQSPNPEPYNLSTPRI